MIVALLLGGMVAAQQVQDLHIPYQYGFEQDDELNNWTLNAVTGSGTTDQWVVGNATHSDGERSLYISTDNGVSPSYGDSKNIVMAYRRIKFPTSSSQENYELSFDWRCMGVPGSSELHLALVPEEAFSPQWDSLPRVGEDASTLSSSMRRQFQGGINDGNGKTSCNALNGSAKWNNASVNINISRSNSAKTFVLMFIWVNGNVDKDATGLGACIDNIQICSKRAPKPKELMVESVCEDSSLVLSFSSTCQSFIVKYKRSDANSWHTLTDIDDYDENFSRSSDDATRMTYKIPEQLPEAAYDIIICGVLNGDTSAYSVVYNQLMYCPENHCVNYMDLDDPRLTCTFGSVKTSPFEYKGYVNWGPDAKESRHTIHTDPNEYDPRTDYGLKCVPDGELGAVRLGNWDVNFEAESMTYRYTVDSASQGILLIKYAVVLQKPGPGCGDPGFSMLILDEEGNEIDDHCGQADFSYTSAIDDGWNQTQDGTVVWKNWTYVGIDLRRYNNQVLQVQLTTKDCGAGGHYGYAYFTIDCISASIKTENCGDDAQITAEAPEGFLYEWRDETGKIWGRQPTLTVDPGQHVYTCRLTSLEAPDCGFEISTESAPRYPVASFETVFQPEDCKNIVKLKNTSHIANRYAGYESHTSEPCNEFEWKIRSLRDKDYKITTNPNPTYTCRNEGDTLEVVLSAYIGVNNACSDVLIDTIVVGSIIGQVDTIPMETCEGNPVEIDGEWYDQTGKYSTETTNAAGCPMIKVYDLKVHPKTPEDTIFDRTCSSTRYMWNGQLCDTSGVYTSFQKNLWGCDSIVHLDLTITDKVEVMADTMVIVCADDQAMVISYNVLSGAFDSLSVSFNDEIRAYFPDTVIRDNTITTLAYPLNANVTPGRYSVRLVFHQPTLCGNLEINLPFEIRYRSAVIRQKWNDVLAVINEQNNGGFRFTAYQWYKNGNPIIGATSSFIYEDLDPHDEYSVLLTRDDGVTLFSCNFRPTDRSGMQVSDYPTLVHISQSAPITTDNAAFATFVSPVGTLYSTTPLSVGSNMLQAPSTPGIYVLHIITDDGLQRSQYVMVME